MSRGGYKTWISANLLDASSFTDEGVRATQKQIPFDFAQGRLSLRSE
ncbi:MAG TPA: hypothetical protein VGG46_05155 [Terriglobales bacterium]|jgi:hypothetical protein